MNQIEKILSEMCPNGIDYLALEKICNRQTDTNMTATKMKKIA